MLCCRQFLSTRLQSALCKRGMARVTHSGASSSVTNIKRQVHSSDLRALALFFRRLRDTPLPRRNRFRKPGRCICVNVRFFFAIELTWPKTVCAYLAGCVRRRQWWIADFGGDTHHKGDLTANWWIPKRNQLSFDRDVYTKVFKHVVT